MNTASVLCEKCLTFIRFLFENDFTESLHVCSLLSGDGVLWTRFSLSAHSIVKERNLILTCYLFYSIFVLETHQEYNIYMIYFYIQLIH